MIEFGLQEDYTPHLKKFVILNLTICSLAKSTLSLNTKDSCQNVYS